MSSRNAYLVLALAVMAFAIYASLIPFDLRMRPVEGAWRDFQYFVRYPPRRVPRADFLANVLLFVPIGFALMGALILDRRRALALPAAVLVIAASVTVSGTAEFLQMFAPGRVPSRYDIAAQTIGTLVGIAAWLAAGPVLTRWLRETARTRRSDRLSRLVTGYVAAWIFVNLAPFNLTFDVEALGRRVRTGRITLVPFGGYDGFSAVMFWDALITTVSAVPLGVFGLMAWRSRDGLRDPASAFGIGALLVVCMEAAHIFIRAHSADSADVIAGCIGVGVGVAAGLRIWGGDSAAAQPPRLAVRTRWILAGLLVWIAVLCAYHWMPYDFAADPAVIRRKLGRMSFVPFAGYYSGSAITAFSNLMTRIGLAIPIGALTALLLPARPHPLVVGVWAAGVVGLFAIIEGGQLFLPSRVPDPTDVLVGGVGSVAGLLVVLWLKAPTAGSSTP